MRLFTSIKIGLALMTFLALALPAMAQARESPDMLEIVRSFWLPRGIFIPCTHLNLLVKLGCRGRKTEQGVEIEMLIMSFC